jgi:TP901 family phage tail tape measure protein
MADEIKLKAPTVEQQVVVNINGEDKLKSFADTLDKISNNKNLQKYWKTQQDLINATTDAYNNFQKKASKDNASELIKVTNALKAMSGTDLSHILPDFDKISKGMTEAQKVAGNIDSAFSVKGFKEAFDSFETLEAYGTDIQKLFSHFGVSSDIGELQQNVRLLESEVEKLTRKLSNARNANEELRNEFDNFKVGSGFADKLDELDRLKAEMQNIRDEATQTFNQFLDVNKIDRYDWFNNDRFAEYFEKLENGTLTASEAIRQFKTEYGYLLEESFKSNGNSFGLDQLQAFSAKLDSIFQQVEETSNKINDILSNGVIAKSVQNLSEDTTLSDSQRSIFGNIFQDEEALKSVTALFQKLIDETNQAKNTEIFNTEQFTKLESLFTSIESSLSSIKGVLVDVGDGEELSPLLKTIANIESAIDNLSSSVKGIGLNMNIDFGSDTEMEAKAQAKISNALQAYQRLFEHIKMSSAGGSIINTKFFDFDINQFDTPMSKLQAYRKFIENMRNEAKAIYGGQDVIFTDTDKKYWTQASSAMGQVTKTFNEMKAASDTNPLENIFGKTDLSGVIEQLNTIVSKLDEISDSAKGFTEAFKDGLNVNASVEEIEKLTNRVKELEDELAKVKTPTTVATSQESNISSGMKDAFPDSSTDTKPETEGMEQVEKATEEAVQAKKEFATANEGVQSSIDGSENPLKLEAELMEQIAKSAREAADAKKEFVEANKQVKDSADKSNNDLVGGHSEIAEPSGVKKYKKKGYKAHDTGNHDNEKKVSNKTELEQALRELQSEIIDSIDESTSFVKEITDFYDSQNDLVKTQTKVGDKNGGVRTYTHSYSTDKEGNTTAWTSHIDSKKYQDQNKIIQEQIKNLQKLSAEKEKVTESERKSTVNQASKDQLEAWKQIQRIRKEIANTNNAKLIEQLKQEKETYQEQYLTATNILKNNSDLYNSEQRLNELKKISLKTTQQIETSQQRQLNGYDNKLSGYQGKVSGYAATINKFGDDGWTSPEYLGKVQEAREALRLYQEAINELKANPDLINKESLANVERLGKDFEKTTLAIKNMTAAQKGYTQLGAEKTMDKISQMLKENSKMSRKAKADIKAWYDQIKSGNPSASLDVILGKVEAIVRAEKDAGRGGKSMWDAIKEKAFYSAASAFGTYFGVNDVFRYVGEGIQVIREFDTALTEMRKVSDETVQSLKNYQATTFDTADAVGTTAKQIQESTADYMRLGESLDEASESAKTANILLNVSEFDNIEDATKSLVSMGQAYKDLDKMTIVDKLNEVGNKYAISTDELATALQKSAATLSLMGNTIDEAASLVTTANATIQDADSVSAGLRTISLRLVGTEEAEKELSAMNEEVDAFVKATNSKKQQIIKDYTAVASNNYQGFDILDSNGNYKNTYEILLGIAKVYKEIQEQDKKLGTNHATALIEELAGKNRSNIASAILQDPTQLEAVKKSSEEAMGSAEKELNSYLDSIDGKMAQLENRAQEFWFKIIDSETIKNGIDLLSTLLKSTTNFVDKVGLLPTILTGIGTALSFKNVGINTLVAY